MNITLVGPIETQALRAATGAKLVGAPDGIAQTPIGPLAKGLMMRGHSVNIVTLDPTVAGVTVISEGAIKVTFCPLRGEPRYRARVRSLDLFEREISYLTQAILENKSDVVHAHWTYEYAEAATRTRLPALVTMHDLGWEYFLLLRDPYRFMKLLMKYRVMHRVKRLSVVSPFMAKKAWLYGYFNDIEVVPNAVNVTEYDPELTAHKSASTLVLVSVGNTGRIKNINASLRAFRIVRERFPDAELHLFGPGLAEGYTNEANVVCHGNVPNEELNRFLREKATLLIHPSKFETFGVIVAEAKANGVPVIGGRHAGGVPFAINGMGGKLVDVDDGLAISTAAIEIYADPEAYKAMSLEAFNDCQDRLSIEVVTSQYERIYETIARRINAHA